MKQASTTVLVHCYLKGLMNRLRAKGRNGYMRVLSATGTHACYYKGCMCVECEIDKHAC